MSSVLLSFGLKTKVNPRMRFLDDVCKTHIEELINNYNTVDVKEPGYD